MESEGLGPPARPSDFGHFFRLQREGLHKVGGSGLFANTKTPPAGWVPGREVPGVERSAAAARIS